MFIELMQQGWQSSGQWYNGAGGYVVLALALASGGVGVFYLIKFLIALHAGTVFSSKPPVKK